MGDESYVVVDTAQSKFYNDQTEIYSPTEGADYYGQDALFDGNQSNYTITENGLLVYDNNTKLTWLKRPDLNGDGEINASDKLSLTDAEAFCAILNNANYSGYNDWRLPTIKELYSLIVFKGTDPVLSGDDTSGLIPFIDTNYFDFEYGDTSAGERIIDAQYLSSTQYVSTTMNGDATVFGVNFADGRIKGYPITKTFYLICVRGNNSYGNNNYTDNGNGTISDSSTGLMWSQTDSSAGLNWKDALAWVQSKNAANFLGHNDWRLPNSKELQSIVDY
ncbi:MAG: DUF1566 domain-containing protein, partial [Deltaproteobacteria bacterium]|nr:DUF1566 domain-containing protein [Deltaproteobacteria bacterium]